MHFRKTIALFFALALPAAGAFPALTASAAVTPDPVISRNCPAYSGSDPATATAANDEHYFTFWSGSAPDYIAYDLSGVPEENRQVIDAVWYNTSSYDVLGLYVMRNMQPSDYTVEVNAAPGGTYPEDGWEVVETVRDCTYSSRQHIVDFAGYNWIRLSITGADGKEGGNVTLNFDVHDVSEGVSDSWMFYGDSITFGGMNNCYGTGFATHVHSLDEAYFPIQENGGIGGITSKDGKENIDRWLSDCKAHFVSIAYGTNDAWGNQTGAAGYYENTVYMIKQILAAGKIPVLPTIPHSTNPDVANYLDDYNDMVRKIYEDYPEVIPGPDFDAFFAENPDMLSGDGVHPNDIGYAEMRRIWAETMYERVYTAEDTPQPGTEPDPEALAGDVNGDGAVNLADVVLLQKYLLGQAELGKPELAELCEDGATDVYDLALLKHLVSIG